jgi:hypothetical protein
MKLVDLLLFLKKFGQSPKKVPAPSVRRVMKVPSLLSSADRLCSSKVSLSNRVLSFLLAFVFLQVETWALSGGPQYGGNTAAVAGTYAGVFSGISGTAVALDPTAGFELVDADGSNALGLFVIGVPQTDIGQGTAALFFEGSFYQGGILGIADPKKQTISGVIQCVQVTGRTNYVGYYYNEQSISFGSRADGTIKCDIENQGITMGTRLNGDGVFTVTALTDEAVVIPDPLNPAVLIQQQVPKGTLKFKVDGFKQSDEVVFPNLDSTAALLNGTGTDVTQQAAAD